MADAHARMNSYSQLSLAAAAVGATVGTLMSGMGDIWSAYEKHVANGNSGEAVRILPFCSSSSPPIPAPAALWQLTDVMQRSVFGSST